MRLRRSINGSGLRRTFLTQAGIFNSPTASAPGVVEQFFLLQLGQ
jgi:hypothetical protein